MATARMFFGPLALVALTVTPVAAGSGNLNCVRSGSAFNCNASWGGAAGGIPRIVYLPSARTEQEQAEARERERKWSARCQPLIRQDRYGVGRYYYAAAGCEFGKYED